MAYQGAIRALNAVEESPWTRSWKHLSPIHKSSWKLPSFTSRSVPIPVPARNRIRQWNIVPGDRIRVRGDKEGTIQEVLGINKFLNRVFLKAQQDTPVRDGERPTPPSVRYEKCQLYIGDREFPPIEGDTEPRVLPVFASRLGSSAPKYIVSLGRFDWERHAVQTVPRINIGNRREKVKVLIPWPKPPTPATPPINAYDTPADVAKQITWRPSLHFYPPSSRTKAKRLQDAYLQTIRPSAVPSEMPEYDPGTDPAIEYVLGDELANPHSRAKKQHRAHDRLVRRRWAHQRFVQAELANLDGRTRAEVLVEAEWKWKEQLRKEDRETRTSRWILRGGKARVKRRRQRKERKQKREIEKMRNLTLPPALNQVLPGTRSI